MAVIAVELMPERNCTRCSANQKINYGCEQDAPIPPLLYGQELKRCPRRPILENASYYGELFWMYRNKKAGFLPEPGGGLETQPAKLMSLFRIIDGVVSQTDHERQRREQTKAARSRRR